MKRLLIIVAVLIALGWGVLASAGHPLSEALARRLGPALGKLGEGKISSPTAFIHQRLLEAMWLFTLLFAWAAAHFLLARVPWRSTRAIRFAWVIHSLVAFICLNVCLAQAARSGLFWGLMWQGKQTTNLARFHLKRILAEENSAPVRATLMGSSQTRAQIDEELLNTLLGTNLYTTELHYPGSKGYDHFLLQPLIAKTRPDYVIIYISETDFYSGSMSEVVPDFLTWVDVPDLISRGGMNYIPKERIAAGLLASTVPAFHLRRVITQRFLGPEITQLKQVQHNTGVTNVLPATPAGPKLAIDGESHFQRVAMEDFVKRCQRAGQRVIILVGQLNPRFSQTIDAAIRREMLSTLQSLAAKFPNITLVEGLPVHSAEDYLDMTHVNEATQAKFTRFIAAWLQAHLKAAPAQVR